MMEAAAEIEASAPAAVADATLSLVSLYPLREAVRVFLLFAVIHSMTE